MRFLFKTDYAADLRLFRDGTTVFWYSVLGTLLLAAPWSLPEYLLAQLVLVCIFSIAGFGLSLLSSFTGQISLGHAAFLAVGAYTEAILQSRGYPFWVSLPAAALLSASAGVVIGLPALRLKGIYLAIATLASGFIVQEIITRWEDLTGGSYGKRVSAIRLFGMTLDGETELYYLCTLLAIASGWASVNILRSPIGRAFVAIRDSEISAQCLGIDLAWYKTSAFALSAALTGIAGALYVHKLQFITPEQFDVILSIQLLAMVVIGGITSLHGAVLGAAFFIVLPQLIGLTKEYLPGSLAQAGGMEPTVFGVVLIGCILYEPLGIYGLWLRIRTYVELFPLNRRGMYRRQRTFMKTERFK